MGYAPRTFAVLLDITESVLQLSADPHSDDGWVPGPRLMLQLRTTARMSESGLKARLDKAVALRLIERRDPLPPHLDQRAAYWRVTESGKQILRQASSVGPAAALQRNTGQTILESDSDQTLKG